MKKQKPNQQMILLFKDQQKWLADRAKELTIEWRRFVSRSEVIRFMIDAHK